MSQVGTKPSFARFGPVLCCPRNIMYVIEQNNGKVEVAFGDKGYGIYTEYFDGEQAENFLEDYRKFRKEFDGVWESDRKLND